ncbi:MAG: endonuclease III [Bacteroidales bacterium]|jgi:endonuclease-3|nr:endonuclease III [Bacteroidales bacterium]
MTLKQKYDYLIRYFEAERPNATSELHYNSAFQLLVAVVLSAQCTDKRVNMITPVLFEHYPTPTQLAAASLEDIFHIVKSVSYPNSKSAHLKGLAEKISREFHGEVPSTREGLESLPGVGRKTANVMLSVWFHQPAMAVDTHVFRVANRLGIVQHADTPLEVEKQLTQHFPKALIHKAHHWLILHGRYVCTAKKPKCTSCGLEPICDKNEKN